MELNCTTHESATTGALFHLLVHLDIKMQATGINLIIRLEARQHGVTSRTIDIAGSQVEADQDAIGVKLCETNNRKLIVRCAGKTNLNDQDCQSNERRLKRKRKEGSFAFSV